MDVQESKDMSTDFSHLNIPSCEHEWLQVTKEIQDTFIKKNTIIDSRPFECENFDNVVAIKACLEKLKYIFYNVDRGKFFEFSYAQRSCVNHAVILCGEHSSKNVWNDDDCVVISNNVIQSILISCACDSLNEYLILNHEDKLNATDLFSIILTKLSKDNWKYYPSICCCFAWLLDHIELPYMKYFLPTILPITLNILEDYATSSKEIGLKCLYQILSNVSAAELQWHIEIKILQNILQRLLYYRESELIILVVKCALEIAEKSQPNSKHSAVNLKWSFYDEILNTVLPLMEFEQNLERRQVYSKSLCLILTSINFSVVRWLPKVLRIIDDYSKTTITELEAIKALNLLLRISWPIIEMHWKRVNVIAGRIIFNSDNLEAIKEGELCIDSLKEIVKSSDCLVDVEVIKSRRRKKLM